MFTVEQANNAIVQVLDEYKDFLCTKNKSYDSSFTKDVQYGGRKIPAMDTIDIRITDKIRRLQSGGSYVGDNDEEDLLGYLLLKKVLRRLQASEKSLI